MNIEELKTKYERRAFYPNLREAEAMIWSRYIAQNPDAFDAVIYNLHVGEGAPIPPGAPEEIARDFKLLTQYKIDVVAFKGDRTYIIEVKPYAGTTAIGQVLSYKKLYQQYIDPSADPIMMIITDQLRPDTQTLTDQMGIRLIIV